MVNGHSWCKYLGRTPLRATISAAGVLLLTQILGSFRSWWYAITGVSGSVALQLEGANLSQWDDTLLDSSHWLSIVRFPLGVLLSTMIIVRPRRAGMPLFLFLLISVGSAIASDWSEQITMNSPNGISTRLEMLGWPIQTLGMMILPLSLTLWFAFKARRWTDSIRWHDGHVYDAAPPLWKSLIPTALAALAFYAATQQYSMFELQLRAIMRPDLREFWHPSYLADAVVVASLAVTAIVLWLRRCESHRLLILTTLICVTWFGAGFVQSEEYAPLNVMVCRGKLATSVAVLALLQQLQRADFWRQWDVVCANCGYFVAAAGGKRCSECGTPCFRLQEHSHNIATTWQIGSTSTTPSV